MTDSGVVMVSLLATVIAASVGLNVVLVWRLLQIAATLYEYQVKAQARAREDAYHWRVLSVEPSSDRRVDP